MNSVKAQTDTLPTLHNTANNIKAQTDKIPVAITTINNIKSATDNISAVKTQTDKIGSMQTTLNTVKSSTDNISAIKSQTDNISAIKSKVDSMSSGGGTGIIKQKSEVTTICNFGGTLSLADQITWAKKVKNICNGTPLNNYEHNSYGDYFQASRSSYMNNDFVVWPEKDCVIKVYSHSSLSNGEPYLILGDTVIKTCNFYFYILYFGETAYVWSAQHSSDFPDFMGSLTSVGNGSEPIIFHDSINIQYDVSAYSITL